MTGKGSTRRRCQVAYAEFERNWEATMDNNEMPDCVCGHPFTAHSRRQQSINLYCSKCACENYTEDPLAELEELGGLPDDKPEGGGSVRG